MSQAETGMRSDQTDPQFPKRLCTRNVRSPTTRANEAFIGTSASDRIVRFQGPANVSTSTRQEPTLGEPRYAVHRQPFPRGEWNCTTDVPRCRKHKRSHDGI